MQSRESRVGCRLRKAFDISKQKYDTLKGYSDSEDRNNFK